MKTILVTAIGGDIAQSIAIILRQEKPGVRLVGVDMHDRHGGMSFVDVYHQVPPASDPRYPEVIFDLVQRENIDVIFPVSENELAVWSRGVFSGEVDFIMPNTKIIDIGLDKLATAKFLEEIGHHVPWTIPVTDGMPKRLPCIIKSRTGSGGKAMFVVRTPEDVKFFARRYPNSVYQELLEPNDREVTCAVYRDRSGNTHVLQMLRKLVGGLTGWATVITDSAVERECVRVAEGTDLKGSINIQLMLTPQGPRIFEINARFSSTILMRHQLGFQDVIWSLDELEGDSVRTPRISSGQVVVRTYGARVI